MARETTGKSFTDQTVSAELGNAQAATADAVTQAAHALSAAERVETVEDSATAHAQAVVSFVDPRTGLPYAKGARGYAIDADVDRQQAQAARAGAEAAEDLALVRAQQAEGHAEDAAASEARALAAEGLVSAGAVYDSVEAYTDLDGLAPVPGRLRLVRATGAAYERVGGTGGGAGAWVYRGNLSQRAASSRTAASQRHGGPGQTLAVDGYGLTSWGPAETGPGVPFLPGIPAAGGGTFLIQSRDGGVQRPEWYHDVANEADATVVTDVLNHAASRLAGGETMVVTGEVRMDPTHGSPFGNFETYGGIAPRSGTTLDLTGAVLTMPPTASGRYSFVRIFDVEDVTVRGGTMVGDLPAHLGGVGEFGMGVFATRCARVNLVDQTISQMWGDGMHIGGIGQKAEDVQIVRPRVSNCRRQGISAVWWERGAIWAPDIRHIAGANPQAGIDFEIDDAGLNQHIDVWGGYIEDCEQGVIFSRGNRNIWLRGVTMRACRAAGIGLFWDYDEVGADGCDIEVNASGFGALYVIGEGIDGVPDKKFGVARLSRSRLAGGADAIRNLWGDRHKLTVEDCVIEATQPGGRTHWMTSGTFDRNRVVIQPGAGQAPPLRSGVFDPPARHGGNLFENGSGGPRYSDTYSPAHETDRYVAWSRFSTANPVSDDVPPSVPATRLVVGEAGGPAFQSGWGNKPGFAGLTVYKQGGRVYFDGYIGGGSPGSTILFLPAGYAPAERHLLATRDEVAVATVDVRSDGAVVALSVPSPSSLLLTGLSFPL